MMKVVGLLVSCVCGIVCGKHFANVGQSLCECVSFIHNRVEST